MNPRRLFLASCLALITTAMAFAIRGDVMDAMGNTFSLTKEQMGQVAGVAFLGFAVSILVGSPLCDFLGMRFLLGLACTCHIVGIVMTIFAPGFSILVLATLVVGLGNGLVEAVINPLIATMYPKDKTHKLNVLHAWWPGGQMIAGILAFCLTRWLTPNPETASLAQMTFAWQAKMGLIIIAAAIYGFLIVGQKFPETERVASQVSWQEMFKEAVHPAFLFWFFLMWLTAATELGPMQWVPDVMTKAVGKAWAGIAVLIYINLIMLVMRHFAGAFVHRLSALGLLTFSSILSAIGLISLSYAKEEFPVFAAATVFACGICYFWPTMLGVTNERFPKGGALLMGLMGTAGNLSVFLVLPLIGNIYDTQTERILQGQSTTELMQAIELAESKDATPEQVEKGKQAKEQLETARAQAAPITFRYVSVAPIVLTILFAILWSFGGYKQVHLEVELENGSGTG